MFIIRELINNLTEGLRQGTIVFLGLICFLAFAANAGVLVWLVLRNRDRNLARCPRCGRQIICPHCADLEDESSTEA